MLIEPFFNYKYVIRFILLNKINFINTFNLPKFKKLIFFFNLSKIEDLNDIQLYNYFYLIKFFFGRNSFFSKIKKYYLLGTWYYNFNIQLFIYDNQKILSLLYYLFNNIIVNVEKNLLYLSIKGKKINIFSLIIKDKNIYSELKTNLGLFNIKKNFSINLYFFGNKLINNKLLMKNIKYI
jgi:hypothetical protein